jgi:hypothetical protein
MNLRFITNQTSAQLAGQFRTDPEGVLKLIAALAASEFLPPDSRRTLIQAALNGDDVRQQVPLH